MAFIASGGAIARLDQPVAQHYPSIRLTNELSQTYAQLYRVQPEVRTVVDFLARNIAQLGLQWFRRVSDTDRERTTDHPAAKLFAAPNPWTTPYRFMDSLVHDLALYDNAFWVKVTTEQGLSLIRVPPSWITPLGDSWWSTEQYRITGSRGFIDVPADRMVHFRGYNPDDSRWGCSPLESLRAALAEQHSATEYRGQLWRSGVRAAGYIKRPQGADWNDVARDRFIASWGSQFSSQGARAGGTPILEDGMEWVQAAFTPKDTQYLEARKLSREEVAGVYHIPPPMIGILDHATFSNIAQQHRMLYQDTLGPYLQQIVQEIHLQVLPDVDGGADVYCEFNLSEKLRGSFEEQAAQLQTSVGGPWVTRNEARARNNLPRVEGGDELIVPLNVIEGGQASPTDSSPTTQLAGQAERKAVTGTLYTRTDTDPVGD